MRRFRWPARTVDFTWPDINSILGVEVTASTAAGDDLIQFVNVGTDLFVDSVVSLADQLDNFADVDLLGTPLPLLNKSLAEILGGDPDPVVLEQADIAVVGEIETRDGQSSFTISLADAPSLADGIQEGDLVVYRGAGGIEFEATLGPVEVGTADRLDRRTESRSGHGRSAF